MQEMFSVAFKDFFSCFHKGQDREYAGCLLLAHQASFIHISVQCSLLGHLEQVFLPRQFSEHMAKFSELKEPLRVWHIGHNIEGSLPLQ